MLFPDEATHNGAGGQRDRVREANVGDGPARMRRARGRRRSRRCAPSHQAPRQIQGEIAVALAARPGGQQGLPGIINTLLYKSNHIITKNVTILLTYCNLT